MMDEMVKKLQEAIEDESADVEKYTEMAETAAAAYPETAYAAVLRDIAREEGVHKRHLEEILSDMHAGEGDV